MGSYPHPRVKATEQLNTSEALPLEVGSGGGVAATPPSPERSAKPNRVPGSSRDEGVAPAFRDEASQPRVAAMTSFRLA